MATKVEKRFVSLNGEHTECLVVGVYDHEQELGQDQLILALPFRDEHVGSWECFDVKSVEGRTASVRLTLAPLAARCGFRKIPNPKFDYHEFEGGDTFTRETLAEAYYSGDVENELNQSFAQGDEEGDAGMEDDFPREGPRKRAPPRGTSPAATRGRVAVAESSGSAATFAPAVSPINVVASSGDETGGVNADLLQMLQLMQQTSRQQTSEIANKFLEREAIEKSLTKLLGQQQTQMEAISTKLTSHESSVTAGLKQVIDRMDQKFDALGKQTAEARPSSGGGATLFPNYLGQDDGDQEIDTKELLSELGLGRHAKSRAASASKPATSATSQPRVHFELPKDSPPPEMQSESTMFCSAIQAMMETQRQMMASLQSSGGGDRPLIDGDGNLNPGSLKGTTEHERFGRRLNQQPLDVVTEWEKNARWDASVPEGYPFSAELYGERCLGDMMKGHSTLHRVWIILCAIYKYQSCDQPERARAQTVQSLKAVAEVLRNKGQWAGAWEYLHLPGFQESGGAISLEERASISRALREKQTIESLVDAARKVEKGDKG